MALSPLQQRAIIDPLRKTLRKQAFDLERYSAPKRVEGRNEDGTINMRALGGECVERSNICTAHDGQLIRVPCGNGFNLLGAAGSAMARTSLQAGTIWVESLDPAFFVDGGSYEVTVTGRGFTPVSVFEFLLPESEDVNPDISIDEASYVSPTEFLLSITVAADAGVIDVETGGLAYDNPGQSL